VIAIDLARSISQGAAKKFLEKLNDFLIWS